MRIFTGLAVLAVAGVMAQAHGQALPTASSKLRLSIFAGATGTYTGLRTASTGEGRNVGITAGVDFGLRTFYHLEPSIEVRGTYPVAFGQVDAQTNILGGLRLAKTYGRVHPYLDILYGRGKIEYQGLGIPSSTGTFFYTKTTSGVLSPGVGVDIDLTRRFAIKADAQLQQQDVPFTSTGHLYAKPVTFGVVYRLGL